MSDAMLEEYTVEESQSGMRLDKFLTEIYPDQTRSFLQKLVKSGEIKVNGKPVIKAGFVVEGGDQVSASIPTPQAVEIEAENIPLDILYEDADVLIVNKPKGMVVHPSAGHYSGTLVNAIMYHCADSLSGINGEIRPGIVHRIDMDRCTDHLQKRCGTCGYRGADQGAYRYTPLSWNCVRCRQRGRRNHRRRHWTSSDTA